MGSELELFSIDPIPWLDQLFTTHISWMLNDSDKKGLLLPEQKQH